MMARYDVERRIAIAELLAQPDPPEIHRAHRLRLEGKPERYALLQQLAAVFVQTKLLALHERRAEMQAAPVALQPRHSRQPSVAVAKTRMPVAA